MDVISGRAGSENPEPHVVTAGNFAPFSSVLQLLAGIRSGVSRREMAADQRPTLGSVDAKTLSSDAFTEDRSLTSLLLSFESLPDGDSGWVLPAIWAGLRKRQKYDFVISTAPPWSSHLAAVVVGKLRGLPVILDDRDPWAGSPGRMLYMTHPLMRRLDRYLAGKCYSRAAGIVCVTEPSCQLHRERPYSAKVPIMCLSNGFDPELAHHAVPPPVHNRIVISYAGSHYHGRSPMVVLKPALALPAEIARDFHFHFVGKMSESEAESINRLEKPFEVTLYGAQSHEFCLDMVSQSDVCLLLAIGQPSQVPAKLYEYIGLHRPVLSISDKDDATMKVLEGQNWAWACAIEDENGLRAALIDIHRRWKNRNMPSIDKTTAERFSFATIARDYSELIHEVL
jgi:glycosyltransferase involved in cell wall biosynthesis